MTINPLNKFCGNPNNHESHSHGDPVPFFWCDGVAIEKEDVYVERYDPTEQAEDGTPYSEITITIKDKDGNVTIIKSEKAAKALFDLDYQRYVSLKQELVPPPIERAIFSFEPWRHADQPITIERKTADET